MSIKAYAEGLFDHLKDEFHRGWRFDSFEVSKEELDHYIDYWNNWI